MPTIKFRNAYVYWNGAFVTEGSSVSLRVERDYIEDTAWGDTNRTYKTGFIDWEMTIGRHYEQGGFFGLESDAIANDPTPRMMYLYPDRAVTGDYWYGASMYASLNSQGGDLSGLWDEQYTIKAGALVTHITT